MATAFEQTSIFQFSSVYNHNKIAFKFSINSRPYSIFQQFPKLTTHFTCIDSYPSPKLVSTNCEKCNSNYISESCIDYFNDDFSVFLLWIKTFFTCHKTQI